MTQYKHSWDKYVQYQQTQGASRRVASQVLPELCLPQILTLGAQKVVVFGKKVLREVVKFK